MIERQSQGKLEQTIYQRFDLNPNMLNAHLSTLDAEQRQELKLAERGRKLVEQLRQKGYIVLVNNQLDCGLPTSVIVGGAIGRKHKQDFSQLVHELKIFFYGSKDFYTDS